MDLIVDFPQPSLHPLALHSQPEEQKRVSFADNSEMIIVDSLRHKYKDDLWFSVEEIKDFKHKTALIICTVKASDRTMLQYAEANIGDTAAFCGLEKYLSAKTTRMFQYRRHMIVRTFMCEQARQIEEDIFDPEAMRNAIVSSGVSTTAANRAYVIALLHAEKCVSNKRV